MAITYRAIKGSELNIAEFDENFEFLDLKIDALTTAVPLTYMPLVGADITGDSFSLIADDFNVTVTGDSLLNVNGDDKSFAILADYFDGVDNHEAVLQASIVSGYALVTISAGDYALNFAETGGALDGFKFEGTAGASLLTIKDSGLTAFGKISFSGTTHAGLRLNQLDTTQQNALTAQNGDIIYNTSTGKFRGYQAGAWTDIIGGGGGGTVTSVSGTSNRITVATGTTTPVIDISSSYVGQTSITTLGTIGTGTWQGGVIDGLYGGTGVANSGKTITLGGNLTTSGGFATTLTMTNTTTVTLPTTGTLATLAGSEALTNKTYNGNTWTAGSVTLTLAGNFITTGAFNTTFAQAATTTVTLPATNSTMARTDAAQTFTGTQSFAGAYFSANSKVGGNSSISGTTQFNIVPTSGFVGLKIDVLGGGANMILINDASTNACFQVGSTGILSAGVSALTSAQVNVKAAASIVGVRVGQTSGTANLIQADNSSNTALFSVSYLGAITTASTLDVTGATTLSSTLGVTGVTTLAANGLVIGANKPTQTLFTQTADATVSNTTATILGTGTGTKTIAANGWAAGRSIRIKIWGNNTTGATPASDFNIKLGSTSILIATNQNHLTGETNTPFYFEAIITCRTTGVSGTFTASTYSIFEQFTIPVNSQTTTSTVTVDTTASTAIDVVVTNTTGDTHKSFNAIIEQLN